MPLPLDQIEHPKDSHSITVFTVGDDLEIFLCHGVGRERPSGGILQADYRPEIRWSGFKSHSRGEGDSSSVGPTNRSSSCTHMCFSFLCLHTSYFDDRACFNLATKAGSSLKTLLTIFSNSSPGTALISSWAFLASA